MNVTVGMVTDTHGVSYLLCSHVYSSVPLASHANTGLKIDKIIENIKTATTEQ